MVPELSIVKLFLNYNTWETHRGRIGVKDLPKELHPVFSLIDNYQNNNESKADLSVADLANLLVANSSRDKDYYLGVLEQLQQLEVSADTTVNLIHSIHRNRLLGELSLAAHHAKEGTGDLEKVHNLLEQYKSLEDTPELEDDDIFSTDDLAVLIEGQVSKPGLRWRLNTLNRMLGSLRKGDFGFVFARPETGKTTFLASEVTFMCEQLGEEDGCVLWINNEEQSDKVKLRCYQASTETTLPQLYSAIEEYDKVFKHSTKGKLKIIKDIAIVHKRQVEVWCKALRPSLIIFDQIDKIVGFDNDREDLKLGAIYQWARELAKTYAPVIAVCQSDATGEGAKWLTMANVANAKTAKQAEADWILGIGKVNDPGWENVRFLHLSKNKLMGDKDTDPALRHGKKEVVIRPEIARYVDL